MAHDVCVWLFGKGNKPIKKINVVKKKLHYSSQKYLCFPSICFPISSDLIKTHYTQNPNNKNPHRLGRVLNKKLPPTTDIVHMKTEFMVY